METKTTYHLSLDIWAKIITVALLLLFLFVSVSSIRNIISNAGDQSIWTSLSLLGISTGIPLISWLFAPQSYKLTQQALVITRPAKDKTILFSEISEVRIMGARENIWNIRTFGVGGLFGYYGKFYSWKLGSFSFYASRRDHQILIETKKGKKLIISPDDISLAEVLKGKIA